MGQSRLGWSKPITDGRRSSALYQKPARFLHSYCHGFWSASQSFLEQFLNLWAPTTMISTSVSEFKLSYERIDFDPFYWTIIIIDRVERFVVLFISLRNIFYFSMSCIYFLKTTFSLIFVAQLWLKRELLIQVTKLSLNFSYVSFQQLHEPGHI